MAFKRALLGNFRFTTYFTGNLLRDEHDRLVSLIEHTFRESTASIAIENHRTLVANLRGLALVAPFVSRSTDQQDLNGATLNYYQVGHRDKRSYTIMNLLQSTLRNSAYAYLRTEL